MPLDENTVEGIFRRVSIETMRRKIFERNPSTGVIRWRYEDESHDDFTTWPNYGEYIKKKKKRVIIGYNKWKRSINK